ncbi:MAG: hypothetical protein AAGE59_25855 [Cyanobacteria bacterium P01_F01_bin.86]
MIRTNRLNLSILKSVATVSLTAGLLLAATFGSYADYVPQGGNPPSGGSTTSGMSL